MPEIKDRKKVEQRLEQEYTAGFVTNVESETFSTSSFESNILSISNFER